MQLGPTRVWSPRPCGVPMPSSMNSKRENRRKSHPPPNPHRFPHHTNLNQSPPVSTVPHRSEPFATGRPATSSDMLGVLGTFGKTDSYFEMIVVCGVSEGHHGQRMSGHLKRCGGKKLGNLSAPQNAMSPLFKISTVKAECIDFFRTFAESSLKILPVKIWSK